MGAELFHADRQTDMMKLTVIFFAMLQTHLMAKSQIMQFHPQRMKRTHYSKVISPYVVTYTNI